MKKLLFLCFSLISTLCFSQIGQVVFQKPEFSGGESAGPMVELNNGYLLYTINTPNLGDSKMNVIVHKLDQAGNIIETHSYGGSGYESVVSATKTINGDVYFAGSSTSNNDNIHSFYLMKFDQYGNFQWENSYNRPNDENCTSIITLSNGNLLLTGTSSDPFYFLDRKAICITPSGTIVWEKIWNEDNLQTIEDAICIPGGYVYMITNTAVYNDLSKETDLYKFDLNGNIIWVKKFVPQNYLSNKISCIEYLPTTNELLIAGSNFLHQSYLAKYDLDGNEINSTTSQYSWDPIRKLKYVSDSLIYLFTELKYNTSDPYPHIQQYNALYSMNSNFNLHDKNYLDNISYIQSQSFNSFLVSKNGSLYFPTTSTDFFETDTLNRLNETNAAFLTIYNSSGNCLLDSISITNGNNLNSCIQDSIKIVAPLNFEKYFWILNNDVMVSSTYNETTIFSARQENKVSLIAFKKNRIYYSNQIIFTRGFDPHNLIPQTDSYWNFCKLDSADFYGATLNATYSYLSGQNLNFQWYRNDTLLVGDTTAKLELPTQNGKYYAIVQNQCGLDTTANYFINSNSLLLSDIPDSLNYTTINGFSCNQPQISVNSHTQGNYQWYKNGIPLLNDTLRYFSPQDSGIYFCTQHNSCAIDTTNNCLVILNNTTRGNEFTIDSADCQNYYNLIQILDTNLNSISLNIIDPFTRSVEYITPKLFRLRSSTDFNFLFTSSNCDQSHHYFYSDTIHFNVDPNQGPILNYFNDFGISCGLSDSTLLSVSCSGPGFTYQWYSSLYLLQPFNPISSNGNNQSFWAKGPQANSTVYYFCRVYNPICGTFQNSDTLKFNVPTLLINNDFNAEHDCSNQLLQLTTGVNYNITTSKIIKYNWYRDNVLINSSSTDSTMRVNVPGNYSGTVYFTNSDSLQTNYSFRVFDRNDFSIASTSICGNDSVQLVADTTYTSTITWSQFPQNTILSNNPVFKTNVPGDYIVNYSLNYGCSIFSNPVHLIQDPASSTEIFSTNNQICNGSIAPLTLGSNLPAGCQFQWYRDNLLLPGASTNSYSATIPGEYKVRITNGTCTDFTGNYTVYANSLSSSQIFSNAQNLICNGGTSILQTAIPSGTFQWYHNTILLPGANQSTYTANTTGIYSCNVTDANGCQGTGAISVINGSTLPFTVASNAPTSICAPSLSQLHLSPLYNNQTYQWYRDNIIINGATNYICNTLDTGNYFCAINNICGIQYSDTLSIIQTPKARAIQPGFHHTPVCVNTPAVLGGNPFAGATTYQWTLPASLHPLSGITSNYLVFQADNSFFSENVILKAYNICNVISDESESIVLTRNYNCPPVYDPTQNTRIRDSGTIDIFPNPTQNNFTIRLNGEELQSIQIINSIGEILRVYIQPKSDIIFGDELPQGIYFIKFTGSDRNEVETVVKM